MSYSGNLDSLRTTAELTRKSGWHQGKRLRISGMRDLPRKFSLLSLVILVLTLMTDSRHHAR